MDPDRHYLGRAVDQPYPSPVGVIRILVAVAMYI